MTPPVRSGEKVERVDVTYAVPMATSVGRREVLAGGGLVAVGGILVACGGGESSSAPATSQESTSEDAATAEETPTESAAEPATGDPLVPVADVPVDGGIVMPDQAVVVVQPAAGQIKAFDAVCPHQGCLMSSVEANEIICPCHGSLFSSQDGSVIQGPARSGLPEIGVVVEGENVYLA